MADSERGTQAGLIGFIRPTTVARLSHRIPTVSASRVPRLSGLLASSFASAPVAGWQALRHRRRIAEAAVAPAPVFIIGHWRSGTTHLHNLMSQDPRFGVVRMFQTIAPDASLSGAGWLQTLLSRVMPRKRPMDAMEWPMDAPQEEEIALAKMTPYSWYLSFLFPRQAVESFDRHVLLNGAAPRVRREVKRRLERVYRIASLHAEGRRLLLKNPVHTCRIPLLLELFPDARFVFIHRSPYEVLSSTLHLHRRILALTSLQEVDEATIERNVVELHRRVTSTYLRDRKRIQPGRLVELAYDELSTRPLDTLRATYDALDIPDFDTAAPRIAAHLEGLGEYRRNRFQLSDRARELVEEQWSEDFGAFGYDRIGADDARHAGAAG